MNKVCRAEDIVTNTGVAALVNGEQVAIFRVNQGGNEHFFALSNFDPFSNANVISRGIVGSIGGQVVVASPIYKQHFRLDNGQCLEDESVSLTSWAVQIQDGDVLVAKASARLLPDVIWPCPKKSNQASRQGGG